MSGYTPVFNTVFDGSLCGKWPDSQVWLTMLALADYRGYIDMTPEAIAARTGWPIELLLQGISSLCSADPRSRSKAEEGRRLVLIDPEREWGWRVVNIKVYRAKASGSDQVTDGRNAEKVRRYKERQRQKPLYTDGHRGTPPGSPDTYSDSDSDSDSSDSVLRTAERNSSAKPPEQDHRAGVPGSAQPPDDSRIGVSDPDGSLDKTIFAECRKVFGKSIGGMVNKAIATPGKGKPFVVEMLEACRAKDPEAARAYFAAGLNGKPKQKAAERRRHPG